MGYVATFFLLITLTLSIAWCRFPKFRRWADSLSSLIHILTLVSIALTIFQLYLTVHYFETQTKESQRTEQVRLSAQLKALNEEFSRNLNTAESILQVIEQRKTGSYAVPFTIYVQSVVQGILASNQVADAKFLSHLVAINKLTGISNELLRHIGTLHHSQLSVERTRQNDLRGFIDEQMRFLDQDSKDLKRLINEVREMEYFKSRVAGA